MAHVRQLRPDSGLGFQVNFLKVLYVVPAWLGSGLRRLRGVDWMRDTGCRGSERGRERERVRERERARARARESERARERWKERKRE